MSIITHKKTRVNTTKYDKDAEKYLIRENSFSKWFYKSLFCQKRSLKSKKKRLIFSPLRTQIY